MLLALTGVKRFRPTSFRDSHCAAQIAEEWRDYREAHLDQHGSEPSLDLLENAYSWSDRLAGHFAQTYRSGHVFNFVLGGIAVCIGLSGFMAPHASLQLALVEFVITLGIILNTKIGVSNQWHRRWLDYRQLAERLRPMRSLKLLGLAAPDPPGSVTNPVSARWIDWYAAGVWRAMGCPSGAIGEERATEIARAVAAFEIAPQVGYHESSAGQIDKLDRRLERFAGWLFMATLIVSVAVIAGQVVRECPSSRITAPGSLSSPPVFQRLEPQSSEFASRAILEAARCAHKRPPTRLPRLILSWFAASIFPAPPI